MRKAIIIGGAAGLALLSSAVVAQVTAPSAEVMAAGERGYTQSCASCHGVGGGGGAGPSLAGNPVMSSTLGVVQMIIQGYLNHGMPPFAHLSDRVVTEISIYVRNAWGNAYGDVAIETVAEIRAGILAAGPGG